MRLLTPEERAANAARWEAHDAARARGCERCGTSVGTLVGFAGVAGLYCETCAEAVSVHQDGDPLSYGAPVVPGPPSAAFVESMQRTGARPGFIARLWAAVRGAR